MVVPFGVTVTIVRQAVQTGPFLGDITGTPTTTDVDGCVIWPTSTSEMLAAGNQDTTVWDLNCLFPPRTDVLSTDAVEVDDVTYQVVGRPQKWTSALVARSAGVLVQLKAAEG